MREYLFLVLVVFASKSLARVQVFGDYSCGQWFTQASRQPAQQWLLGYLSGQKVVIASREADPLKRPNFTDQAFSWMDKYCKANPSKRVSEGGMILYRQLRQGLT